MSENPPTQLTLLPPTPRKGAFTRRWKELERWDTFFYRIDFIKLESDLDRVPHLQLGQALNFEFRGWKKDDFPDGKFRYIEISAVTKDEGIRSVQDVLLSEAPTRATTRVKEGDVILSTTRPYLGAFAIVPAEYDGCVCSSGFALATGFLRNDIDPEFLLLFLRSEAGLKQFERRMTGGLYPAIVQEELEKIRIPLLSLKQQLKVAALYKREKARVRLQLDEAMRRAKEDTKRIDQLLVTVGNV